MLSIVNVHAHIFSVSCLSPRASQMSLSMLDLVTIGQNYMANFHHCQHLFDVLLGLRPYLLSGQQLLHVFQHGQLCANFDKSQRQGLHLLPLRPARKPGSHLSLPCFVVHAVLTPALRCLAFSAQVVALTADHSRCIAGEGSAARLPLIASLGSARARRQPKLAIFQCLPPAECHSSRRVSHDAASAA